MNTQKCREILLEICNRYCFVEVAKEIEDQAVANMPIRVVVLGEFSSGKSTLVNALIGKPILPTFDCPTTAMITEIAQGSADRCLLVNDEESENGTEIPLQQLESVVTSAVDNRRLVLEVEGLDFLGERVVITDTPGLSSIEEGHEQITYGYLPYVDIAIVVLDIKKGTVPGTMLDFLRSLPPQIQAKMVFLANFMDQVPPNRIEPLCDGIGKQLAEVIDQPQLFPISAKDALAAKVAKEDHAYAASNVGRLETSLTEQVVRHKSSIIDRRIADYLRNKSQQIKELLEYKLYSLKWDDSEYEAEVARLARERDALEQGEKELLQQFRTVKEKTIEKANELAKDYASIIAASIANDKNKSLEPILEQFTSELGQLIEYSVGQLESLESKSKNISVSRALQTVTGSAIRIRQLAEAGTDIATFLLVAWLIPGPTKALDAIEVLGAGISAAAHRLSKANMEKSSEFPGSSGEDRDGKEGEKESSDLGENQRSKGEVLAELFAEVNVINKLQQAVLPYAITGKLHRSLAAKLTKELNSLFDQLESELRKGIHQQYRVPIAERERAIAEQRKQRDQMMEEQERIRSQILQDIDLLEQ